MEYCYEDNTKLRIVLLLNEKIKNLIIKLNQQINTNIPHDIEFSENCIPHVTLISGKLKNKNDFELVSKIINNKIEQFFTEELIINFDEFYFSPDGKWLFLSLEENAVLSAFIDSLREELKDLFIISDARHLHVTVAKSDEMSTKKILINNTEIPQWFSAKNIGIGLSGNNGILLNLIEEFDIKNLIKSV